MRKGQVCILWIVVFWAAIYALIIAFMKHWI